MSPEERKKFHVTGTCIPEKNYMVDISEKISKIICMIEDGEYFTINRARQFGKTTTLNLLYRKLRKDYLVISLSFEAADEYFQSQEKFVKGFAADVSEEMRREGVPEKILSEWLQPLDKDFPMKDLSRKISNLCNVMDKEVLLFIDEVDKSPDNQIFLNFLGMLRNKYLAARAGKDKTFQSVILAGVYDVKNLKLKMRTDEEKKYNSPWNVAADFKVDMNFSAKEISTMLREYEEEQHAGLDVDFFSEELYRCTGGYPFLVSSLCKWIDEDGEKKWTVENLRNAQKELLKNRNTLFDDLIKNLENHKELKHLVMNLLCDGVELGYTLFDPVIELGTIFGIFKEQDGKVAISNRIFEICLYDYAISVREREEKKILNTEASQFIKDGKLDMPQVMMKFQEVMQSEYRREDEAFLEKQGRLLFLCFLKPIINGTGFYYVEPETRNNTRMDLVVNYGAEEYIIELKIWRGSSYREDGIRQLERYMENRGAEKGYLLSFSFLERKEYRAGWLKKEEAEKKIFEVTV